MRTIKISKAVLAIQGKTYYSELAPDTQEEIYIYVANAVQALNALAMADGAFSTPPTADVAEHLLRHYSYKDQTLGAEYYFAE